MSASFKTKKYIAENLIQLSEKKRLCKISVVDLCRECDINRSTFYYHFRDIKDVIQWIYHTEASIPVREGLVNNTDPKDTSFVTKHILNNLYSHQKFYVQAIKLEGQNSLEEYILKEAKENWKILIDTRLAASDTKSTDLSRDAYTLLKAALDYYCYGHFIITVNWMKRGMDIDPNKLAELMDTVALQGFDEVMELFT